MVDEFRSVGGGPFSVEEFSQLSRGINKLIPLAESLVSVMPPRAVNAELETTAELKRQAKLNKRAEKAKQAQINKQTELAKHAQLAQQVQNRVRGCEASVERNQKRSMTWGGIALVLAAIGSALVVNRLVPDSSANDPTRGVSLLQPITLVSLSYCLAVTAGAIAVILRTIGSRHQPEAPAPSASRRQAEASTPNWALWLIVATAAAACGTFAVISGAQGSGPAGAFRFGHGGWEPPSYQLRSVC